MSITPEAGTSAAKVAAEHRARALLELRRIGESDDGRPLPWLMEQVFADPYLLRLRVWNVEQAVFGTGHAAACRHVEQTAMWTGGHVDRPEKITLSWLLDAKTNGVRWSAWLVAVSVDLGYRIQGPDPFRL